MDYEYRAAKTPLIDLIRKVPKDGRHMYDESPVMAHNIPYGRLCHEAADELEAWNRRASQEQAASDHIEDVRGMVSDEPVAYFQITGEHQGYKHYEQVSRKHRNDKDVIPLFTHPQPAQPCAIPVLPVVATDHPDIAGGIKWSDCELRWINEKLAALEAENARLTRAWETMQKAKAEASNSEREVLGWLQEAKASIAQQAEEIAHMREVSELHAIDLRGRDSRIHEQAERIKQLERAVKQNDETAQHYLAGRTEALQQLAAAQKDAERYRWIRHNSGYSVMEMLFIAMPMYEFRDEHLDEAIDAQIDIAAHKEEE